MNRTDLDRSKAASRWRICSKDTMAETGDIAKAKDRKAKELEAIRRVALEVGAILDLNQLLPKILQLTAGVAPAAQEDAHFPGLKSVESKIAIPLLVGDRLIGVFNVESEKPYSFQEEDEALLTTIGSQLAIAIENAGHYQRLEERVRQRTADLNRSNEELRQAYRELQETQAQLVQSEKMASLGRLVAGIAHELNTPIGAIRSYSETFTRCVKEVRETLENIPSLLVSLAEGEDIERNPERPELEKQERDVSILFLDIAGYTRMSEEMSLDKINYVVERYFSSFLDDIYAKGGDVNETAGDGMMILFQDQDPRLHAVHAIQTALAIQRKSRGINEQLVGEHEPVIINIGINSGRASVGSTRIEGISGTRWTYAISNQFMNKTARNLAENPRISVLLIDFPGIRTVQLHGRLERMEDSGPMFEEMSRRIDAIDTEFNLGGLFKLRAVGIVKIHEIFE